MASKRKSVAPKKCSEAKRRRISWCSPFGILKPNKEVLINDDEILFLEEYEKMLAPPVTKKSPRKYSKKQNIDDNSSEIVKNCSFYVVVFTDVFCSKRTLACFDIWPDESSESMNELFYFLVKSSKKLWIYINETCNIQYAYFQLNDILTSFNVSGIDYLNVVSTTSNETDETDKAHTLPNLNKTTSTNMFFKVKTTLAHNIWEVLRPKEIILYCDFENNFKENNSKLNPSNCGKHIEGKNIAFAKYIEEESLIKETIRKKIEIKICLMEEAILNMDCTVESKKLNNSLLVLMPHFYGIPKTGDSEKKVKKGKGKQSSSLSPHKFDINQLYGSIRLMQNHLHTHNNHHFKEKDSHLFKDIFEEKNNENIQNTENDKHPTKSLCENADDIFLSNGETNDLIEDSDLLKLQPICLRPQLRKYQRQAVRWMLTKEGFYGDDDEHSRADELIKDSMMKVQLWDGSWVIYNRVLGVLFKDSKKEDEDKKTFDKPNIKASSAFKNWNKVIKGGILADEMGLGKTVEVLALIFLHPRKMEPSNVKNGFKSLYKSDSFSNKKKNIKKPRKNKKSLNSRYYIENGEVISNIKQLSQDLLHTESPTTQQSFTNTNFHNAESNSSTNSCSIDTNTSDKSAATSHDITKNISLRNVTVELSRIDENEYAKKMNISPIKTKTNTNDAIIENNNENDVSNNLHYMCDETRNRSLECICGEEEDSEGQDNEVLTCVKCASRQHASCVKYDMNASHLYLCPHCHVTELPRSSGCTLIISPSSILPQWIDEVIKHVSNHALKLFVYTGVHTQGYIQPHKLAQQNIVFTSYETLRKELHYVDLPHSNLEGRLRGAKKYNTIPSPIVAVEWWRICLDEAQMVESTSTKSAEMASRLSAVMRWCVTGTPIQRSLDDVYGLISFLRLEPFNRRWWWQRYIQERYMKGDREALVCLLSDVLWRSCKIDVIDQICLPNQMNEIHFLTFTPFEEHFYRRVYQESCQEATMKLAKMGDLNVKLNTFDKKTLHQLMYPLLKVRQACCHPQAVRTGFISVSKSAMTMSELLLQMIKKVRLECEEAQRQIVAATNGMAGWMILNDDLVGAVNEYRTVISLHMRSSGNDNKHNDQTNQQNNTVTTPDNSLFCNNNTTATTKDSSIRVDSLQVLHAIHNLSQILPACDQSQIGHTLYHSQLPDIRQQVEERYLSRKNNFVLKMRTSWLALKSAVTTGTTKLNECIDWWGRLLAWCDEAKLSVSLIEKLYNDLSNNSHHFSIACKFRDTQGLRFVLHDQISRLTASRQSLVSLLTTIDQSMHKRQSNKNSKDPSQQEVTSEHESNHTNHDELPQEISNEPYFFDESCKLDKNTSMDQIVFQTVNCCLRSKPANNKFKCVFCKAHRMFEAYENILFSFDQEDVVNPIKTTKKKKFKRTNSNEPTIINNKKTPININKKMSDEDEDDDDEDDEYVKRRKGNWSDSEVERILKSLIAFSHKNSADKRLLEAGSVHISLFDGLKKEFKILRVYWQALREKVCAVDETMMAVTRLRLRQDGENVGEEEHHIIEKHALPEMRLRLQADKRAGEVDLRKRKAQLNYLQNLIQSGETFKDGINPEPCPICQNKLASQWCVLQCGHCLCLHCIRFFTKSSTSLPYFSSSSSSSSLKCPICRQFTLLPEVSYVSTKTSSSSLPSSSSSSSSSFSAVDPKIKIKGDWSTKIEAVVRLVITITNHDASNKVLIFSTWIFVLELIATALTENNIRYASLLDRSKFEENLQVFKQQQNVNCLLLPISTGSNGLNLIEASHAIIVEPVLNQGQDLQAVGRMHRIGQTRPTFIHRLIVKGTVEERLHKLLSSCREVPNETKDPQESTLTLTQLHDLLDAKAVDSCEDDVCDFSSL